MRYNLQLNSLIINYKVNELTARTVPFCMSEVALDRRPERLLIKALPFVLINYNCHCLMDCLFLSFDNAVLFLCPRRD